MFSLNITLNYPVIETGFSLKPEEFIRAYVVTPGTP
jgi:hypothetical protein